MSEDAYKNMSFEQMEFAVFCVGLVAEKLDMSEEQAYDLLDKNNVLKDYIVDLYDILHTQGQGYIADDIIDYMKVKGIIK